MTVRADHRYEDAQWILREHDACDVESRHQGVAAADATPMRSTPELLAEVADALPLREEEHGPRSTALGNELLSLEESPVGDLKQDLTCAHSSEYTTSFSYDLGASQSRKGLPACREARPSRDPAPRIRG